MCTMKKHYRQLSLEEREQLAILRASGQSLRGIAKILNRHHSTLSREWNRNQTCNKAKYIPCQAHRKACVRKQLSGYRVCLKNPEIRRYVHKRLSLFWSPELIAGRLKLDYPGFSISHEAIYQYIYREAPQLIACLPRRHAKRRIKGAYRKAKKSKIPNRISIHERPEHINDRSVFGHWEADTVVSRQNRFVLNVLVERQSRFTKITRLSRNTAHLNQRAIKLRLSTLPPYAAQSITYDNGSENTQHEQVNDYLGSQSYFCEPYHSWEKGTVEQVNGLIRRFLPKKTNFEKVKPFNLIRIEMLLNHRPRKCLGFKTPAEAFSEQCAVAPL